MRIRIQIIDWYQFLYKELAFTVSVAENHSGFFLCFELLSLFTLYTWYVICVGRGIPLSAGGLGRQNWRFMYQSNYTSDQSVLLESCYSKFLVDYLQHLDVSNCGVIVPQLSSLPHSIEGSVKRFWIRQNALRSIGEVHLSDGNIVSFTSVGVDSMAILSYRHFDLRFATWTFWSIRARNCCRRMGCRFKPSKCWRAKRTLTSCRDSVRLLGQFFRVLYNTGRAHFVSRED